MIRIIENGTSVHDYDWRITECADTNGSKNIYVLERNQGAHDCRFFIISASEDKNEIVGKAHRFHNNQR